MDLEEGGGGGGGGGSVVGYEEKLFRCGVSCVYMIQIVTLLARKGMLSVVSWPSTHVEMTGFHNRE